MSNDIINLDKRYNFFWRQDMSMTVSEQITLCPVGCTANKKCYRRDADGMVTYIGKYILVCEDHGTQEVYRVSEGSSHGNDWYSACKFCGKSREEHEFAD